jgi:hypothetical protein
LFVESHSHKYINLLSRQKSSSKEDQIAVEGEYSNSNTCRSSNLDLKTSETKQALAQNCFSTEAKKKGKYLHGAQEAQPRP